MRIVLLAWLAMGCGAMGESSRRWPAHRHMQDEREARIDKLETLMHEQDETIKRLTRRIYALEKQPVSPAPAEPAPPPAEPPPP